MTFADFIYWVVTPLEASALRSALAVVATVYWAAALVVPSFVTVALMRTVSGETFTDPVALTLI